MPYPPIELRGAIASWVCSRPAGGSKPTYEVHRQAGIDLAEPAPYQALFRCMDRVMDQIEALVRDRH